MRLSPTIVAAGVALMLLLAVAPSPASAACTTCPNCVPSPALPGGKSYTWTSTGCTAGYPIIESMYISAESAMPFTVSTFDPADSTTIYSAGTSTTTLCFEASSTTSSVIGGAKHVSVKISCEAPSPLLACSLYMAITTKCQAADLCADVDCGDNGDCDSDTGSCTCDSGYSGTTCGSKSNSASTRASDGLMAAMLAGAALAMAM